MGEDVLRYTVHDAVRSSEGPADLTWLPGPPYLKPPLTPQHQRNRPQSLSWPHTGRNSEGVGDRGSEVGGRRSGVGDRGSGVGDRGSEVGGRGSEIGDRGSVVGGRGSGVGGRRSGVR